MSCTSKFNFSDAKSRHIYGTYELVPGHALFEDSSGKVCIHTEYEVIMDGGSFVGINAGLLREEIAERGEAAVFVAVTSNKQRIVLRPCDIDMAFHGGPHMAYYLIDIDQLRRV